MRTWMPTWTSCTSTWECEHERRGRAHKRRSGMKYLISSTALAVALTVGTAQAQTTVKIGVLSDMSSLYSDIGGPPPPAAAPAPPPRPPAPTKEPKSAPAPAAPPDKTAHT